MSNLGLRLTLQKNKDIVHRYAQKRAAEEYLDRATKEIRESEGFKPYIYDANKGAKGTTPTMTVGSGLDSTQNPNILDPGVIDDTGAPDRDRIAKIKAGLAPITEKEDTRALNYIINNTFVPDLHSRVGEDQFKNTPTSLQSAAVSDRFRGIMGPKQAKSMTDLANAKNPEQRMNAVYDNLQEGIRHQTKPGVLGINWRSFRILQEKLKAVAAARGESTKAEAFARPNTKDPRVAKSRLKQMDTSLERSREAALQKLKMQSRNMIDPLTY